VFVLAMSIFAVWS